MTPKMFLMSTLPIPFVLQRRRMEDLALLVSSQLVAALHT